MSGRRPGRYRTGPGRPFVTLAAIVVALLVVGSLAVIIPIDDRSSNQADLNDAAVQVTPGAEVARLETAVATNPNDVDSMIVLAEVLANSGRVSSAISWFERAIEERPADATLRVAFAAALLRSGNYYDAEVQYRRAAELDATDPEPAYYLGRLYEQMPEPQADAAREWYERAIEIAPDSLIAEQARERLIAVETAPSPTATP